MTELAPGPIMIDIDGLSLTALDKEKLAHPNTGGLILFARNYENPQQITSLINDIRKARNGTLLIATDQEGGRVQRFQQGFTRLPPAAAYANYPLLAQEAGWLMAIELISCGVDFSFAPVLDIDYGISEIIGNRAFSSDPEQTSELAMQFMSGMHQAGMAAIGKHFPGHGAVAPDSHLTLPIDNRDLNAIIRHDLMPFSRLISAGLDGVMPAHVLYPLVDSQPAGFSAKWLQDILRGNMGFNGAIFSDDLSMAGAACAGDYPTRAEAALFAGCDMLLICNNVSAAEKVLDYLNWNHRETSTQRLLKLRARQSFSRNEFMQDPQWRRISVSLNNLSAEYA